MIEESAQALLTRATLLVVGGPASLPAWKTALARHELTIRASELCAPDMPFEIPLEWVPNDGRFGAAFALGTISPVEQAAVHASGSALLLSLPVELHREGDALTHLFLRLHLAGALAVRVEESGLGWMIDRWISALRSGPSDLYRRVVVTLTGSARVYSLGMHAFGLPDASIEADDDDALEWLDAFNRYQLLEAPVLCGGSTFRPDPDRPRRVIERWPASAYPSGHLRHNPYGEWRLGPKGGVGRPPRDKAIVFIPSLISTLRRAEQRAGRALSEDKVHVLTDMAVTMLVEHADLALLERQRGYADLDPERVWEQWQIVRAAAAGGDGAADAGGDGSALADEAKSPPSGLDDAPRQGWTVRWWRIWLGTWRALIARLSGPGSR